jgi:hypothetical protein
MVNDTSDDAKDRLPTSLRLTKRLKSQLERSAKANRRTLTAEIVARLDESLGLNPAPPEPVIPLASDTALRALSRTEEHAARLNDLEARLRKLETRK